MPLLQIKSTALTILTMLRDEKGCGSLAKCKEPEYHRKWHVLNTSPFPYQSSYRRTYYALSQNFPVIHRGTLSRIRASKFTSSLMNAGTVVYRVHSAYAIASHFGPPRIVVLNGNCRRAALWSPVNSTKCIVRPPIDLKVLSGEESREMRKMINENCGNDSRYCETRLVETHSLVV